jgi:hypothetical protein
VLPDKLVLAQIVKKLSSFVEAFGSFTVEKHLFWEPG